MTLPPEQVGRLIAHKWFTDSYGSPDWYTEDHLARVITAAIHEGQEELLERVAEVTNANVANMCRLRNNENREN